MMINLLGHAIYAFQSIHRRRFLRKIRKYVDLIPGKDYTIEAVGSRMTCMPPPRDTDQDWLIEVKNDKARAEWLLFLEVCYQNCNKYGGIAVVYADEAPERFKAYRKGKDNVILTWDEEFAKRWRIAHNICKKFNLQTKQERINCFELCRAGRHTI